MLRISLSWLVGDRNKRGVMMVLLLVGFIGLTVTAVLGIVAAVLLRRWSKKITVRVEKEYN